MDMARFMESPSYPHDPRLAVYVSQLWPASFVGDSAQTSSARLTGVFQR